MFLSKNSDFFQNIFQKVLENKKNLNRSFIFSMHNKIRNIIWSSQNFWRAT